MRTRTLTLYWRYIWIFFFRSVFFNLLLCQLLDCCWRDRLNHPMLITLLFYCYFNLKINKSLIKTLSTDGVPKRGLNWQHSNSYITPRPTGLFCDTILIFFANSNILTNFNALPDKYWGSTYPYMIFQCNNGILSSRKVLRYFLLEQIYEGAVLHGGLMIRSCQGLGSFTNAFFSNLNSVNLKISPNRGGICTWR